MARVEPHAQNVGSSTFSNDSLRLSASTDNEAIEVLLTWSQHYSDIGTGDTTTSSLFAARVSAPEAGQNTIFIDPTKKVRLELRLDYARVEGTGQSHLRLHFL
jgi:hypothetical protein